MFRLVLGFFAGVLATLFLLVPGKTGPTVLVNGDAQGQVAQLDQAGQRLNALGDKALSWAYHARDFIRENAVKEGSSEES